MAVSYSHACRFRGKPIMARTRDGRAFIGVVRGVTPEAIWLEMMDSRVSLISAKSQKTEITFANYKNDPEVETVQFFNPFFRRRRIIPLVLFDLLAISLFAW